MAEGHGAAGANTALDAEVAAYAWMKLHTGAPGASGTSTAAGNTTRKQVTWSASSGGAVSNSGLIQWTNVSTSEDYTHFSMWSASSAGSFGFSGPVTAAPVTAGNNFEIAVGDLDVSLTLAS